jgi:hypothetical protein
VIRCLIVKRKLDKLSVTLGKLLAARGMQGCLQEYRVGRAWRGAVGTVIARHAQPASIRRGRLTVIVDSPAWMQQLSLLKPEIIEKLNTGLGAQAIRDIMLTLGEVAAEDGAGATAVPDAALSAEERERIANSVRDITDETVRGAVQRLFEKDRLSRKKNRGGPDRG